MAGILFRTVGKIYSGGERTALLLSKSGERFTLRLAYVVRGTEERFLPESVLDDWGHEITGSELYRWVKENAAHFPRAELFGFDLSGRPQQCFIRELDLTSRCVPYVYAGSDAPIETGVQVHAILLTNAESNQRQIPEAPKSVTFPLREAAVEWWLVLDTPSKGVNRDFSHVLGEDEIAQSGMGETG